MLRYSTVCNPFVSFGLSFQDNRALQTLQSSNVILHNIKVTLHSERLQFISSYYL